MQKKIKNSIDSQPQIFVEIPVYHDYKKITKKSEENKTLIVIDLNEDEKNVIKI